MTELTTLEATSRDVWAAIALFLGFPSTAFGYMLWREWRRLRRERAACQTEAETSAAEGYPPPDPPTTDSIHPLD